MCLTRFHLLKCHVVLIKQLVLPSGGFININTETREILILIFFKNLKIKENRVFLFFLFDGLLH